MSDRPGNVLLVLGGLIGLLLLAGLIRSAIRAVRAWIMQRRMRHVQHLDPDQLSIGPTEEDVARVIDAWC